MNRNRLKENRFEAAKGEGGIGEEWIGVWN